ncbi:MarR family winged helix-turn-helix transcriptional regulator [Allostreptomyces psammosilenae]|uniref:DNA-binding MarR family transcriptional regulator n=1 Tax=Allostreptomyces psammosilenae TaxID=1892865 RepID=A0A852ZQI6_9ACTN|nr:MarR family transcriptional regulator [Allostreptomyces psammosilenae]NYI04663.1 DNA-binding MarR family transcriptional regulator [Allostreptomyces psammosilenae]
MSTPPPSDAEPASASADVAGIERALTRIAYLNSRVRQHERLMAMAGVSLDRAAVALLRQVAASEPLRPGELASRLAVEASHVTRQVQQLQKAGYVTRVPDAEDRRAQRIRITPAGRDAMDRVTEVSVQAMRRALAQWSPRDLRQLATLLHRLVDDFVAHAESAPEEEAGPRRPS